VLESLGPRGSGIPRISCVVTQERPWLESDIFRTDKPRFAWLCWSRGAQAPFLTPPPRCVLRAPSRGPRAAQHPTPISLFPPLYLSFSLSLSELSVMPRREAARCQRNVNCHLFLPARPVPLIGSLARTDTKPIMTPPEETANASMP